MVLPRYRVELLPEASADLVSIHEYIRRDSPPSADAVLRRLIASIDSLDQIPKRCRVHRSSKNRERIVRAMSVNPYIIYYRVFEREWVVQVLTVRHGARRQPKRFR
jgi:plasmid stabilization system protein ParE